MSSSILSSEQSKCPGPASSPGDFQAGILRTLLFLGLALGMVLATGEPLQALTLRLDPNVPKILEMLSLQGRQDDVVFLGNSTVLDSVNPQVIKDDLGLSSYNLATGGQNLLESRLVLENYLEHNQAPRLVALGIYVNKAPWGCLLNPNVFLGLSPSSRREAKRAYEEYCGEPLPRSYSLFNRFKAYRFRNTIDSAIKFLIAGESRVPTFIQGHLAMDYSREVVLDGQHETRINQAALDAFLSLCRERRISVFLFEPPGSPGYSAMSQGREQVLDALEERVGRAPVLAFRSFSDQQRLDYPDNEWLSMNHLNARGARRFTHEQMVPAIQSLLPSSHPEKADRAGASRFRARRILRNPPE